MIGPPRKEFETWAIEVGEGQRKAERLAEEAEKRQREQERQEREAVKEAQKKQKKETRAWEKRKREDEQLLRKNGAFAVFKEAAEIMKKHIAYPSQQGPEVEIAKPEFGEEPKEVHVRLCWGNCTGTPIDSRLGERHWLRQSNGVFCFVARDENSNIKGLRLSGSDEIIPLGDRELLTTRLLEKVKSDPIVKWFSLR